MKRSNFLQSAGLSTIFLTNFFGSACNKKNEKCQKEDDCCKKDSYVFSENDIILFQGDSITDAGRDKVNELPNNQSFMGLGYASLITAKLLSENPKKNLKIYNRGISGNKVYQLDERWEKDCLTLKPNILSIMIGVNDFWHTLTHNYNGTLLTYKNDYKKLLDKTKKELPNVKLILCEPFVIKGGSAIVEKDWFPFFDEYQNAVKEIANEYKAIFVPFQSVFDNALKEAGADFWCPDGVHPSLAGSQLMANEWLKNLNKNI